MNAFEGYFEELNTTDFDFIDKGLKPIQDLNKAARNYFGRINEAIKKYQESGVVPPISTFENWEAADDVQPVAKPNERSSIKENIEPKETNERADSPPRTRPRRNAFKEATQNINEQSAPSTGAKLRRPPKLQEPLQNVYVKIEKLSICGSDKSDSSNFNVNVKTESEEMPAPNRPAPRKKKRKESKVQVKQEKIERDSDVIIEDPTLTTINLVDSDDGEKTIKNEEVEEKRSTRARTKQKKAKRSRTYSSEEEKNLEKRSKSDEAKNQTNYEDALSTVEANTTYAVVEPQQHMNATVVIEKPTVTQKLIPKTIDDIMTDDESEEEVKKEPPKPIRSIPKPTKQVFSPFEQSPVKKKVEAFEKLHEANSLLPRVTRTKTRAQAKEQEETDIENEPKSNVKEKAKMFTPTTSKFVPKAASTTLKTSRIAPSSSNESLLSAKSASALKASQAEYREREKKRREKEQDALKKRDALVQAQIEEKKRKREEKQLKAQQQREALEKEKLKVLEAQRLKDERHKQVLAEQEERKQKQKEEVEKKRMMAKLRAIEEKKREEEKRIEEQKKAEEMAAKLAKQNEEMARMLQKQKQKLLPVYMRTKLPLLPTKDCYDSDDEDHRNKVVDWPEWTEDNNLQFMQMCASAAGDAIKNSFFSIQAQTPDLQDIFEVIEPQKLKRTSSAVWHRPPRFTMMPALENHDETEEFDEDD